MTGAGTARAGDRRWAAVGVVTVLLAGVAPTFAARPVVAASALALLAVMALVVWRDAPASLVDTLILTALLWLLLAVPFTGLWPLPAAAALVLTAVFAWRARRLQTWRRWWRRGHADRSTWWLVTAIVVVTAVSLVTWQRLSGAGLGQSYAEAAVSVPVPLLALGVFGFLAVNGAVEDSIWSGVLLSAAERVLPVRVAVGVVALSFGLAHLQGVPGGLVGAGMAGAWGALLALLRLRTGGMLATYLAHIAADATIVVILLPAALRS